MSRSYPKKHVLALAVGLALALDASAQTVSSTALPVSSTALPAGGTVVGGQAAIATQGAAMSIEQTSARAAIDWQSFNIGSQASVTFHQPSASAIALNRVLGTSGSEIYGRLSANGQVFLINPNGVLFGRGAQVDVGALLASPLDLSPADFMSGRYNLAGGGTGAVVNRGAIRTAPGGYAALIAPSVLNEGTIESPGGAVTLAAASAATLDFMADGLVRIRIDRGALAAEAANHGVISADGGAVLLKAESLDALAPSVVNMTGIIEAQTVEQADGVVRLGSVELRADRVDVSSEARIDASSIVAWGTDVAHVHGTLRARGAGGSGGFVETSGHVLDVSGIRIDAGNGGEWLLDPWDLTISNNADVAVSGTDAIGTLSNLNASVIQRALDSGTSVTVTTGGQGTETGNITVFGTADQGGAVNLAMTGAGNAVLTLQAAGSIDIHSGVKITSSSGALGLTLNSGNDNGVATGSGAINVDGATIATNGGDVVMGGGTSPLTGAAIGTQALVNGKQLLDGVHIGGNTTIATGAGSVTLNGQGASDANNARGVLIDGNSRITVDGGSVTLTGTGGTGGANNTGNEGVRIEGAIVESRSGAGTINISGTGGSGSDVHTGVRIASATVRTVDANISINGVAGGTGDFNAGVLMDGGSLIETSGSGFIDIAGTSGAGANRNFGISLENSTVRSTASGTGSISLDGTALGGGAPNDGIRLEGGAIESLNTADGSSIDLSGIGSGPGGNGVLALTGSPNPSHIRALSGSILISGQAADSSGVGVWVQTGSTLAGGMVDINAVGRVDIAEDITTVSGLADTSVTISGDGVKVANVITGSAGNAAGFGAGSSISISANGDIATGALRTGDATAGSFGDAASSIGISATGKVSTGDLATGKASAGSGLEVQSLADSGVYIDGGLVATGAIQTGAASSVNGNSLSMLSLVADGDMAVAGAIATGSASGGQGNSSVAISASGGGVVPASIDISGTIATGDATSTTSGTANTTVQVIADDNVTIGGLTAGLSRGVSSRNTTADVRALNGTLSVGGPVTVTGADGSDASGASADASGGNAFVLLSGGAGVTTGAISATGGSGAIATAPDVARATGGWGEIHVQSANGPVAVKGALSATAGKGGTANGASNGDATGGMAVVTVDSGSGTSTLDALTAIGGDGGSASASDSVSGGASAGGGSAEVTIGNSTGDLAIAGPVTLAGGTGGSASGVLFANANGGQATFFGGAQNTITIGAGGIAVNGGQGAGSSLGGRAEIELAWDSCGDGCIDPAGQVQVGGDLSATAGNGSVALVSVQATSDIALGANISTLGEGTLNQAGAPAGIQLVAGNTITSSTTATLSAVRNGNGDVYVDLTAQNGIGTLQQPIRIQDNDNLPPTGPVLLAHNNGTSGDIAIAIAFNGGTLTVDDWAGVLNSNPDGAYLVRVENGTLAFDTAFLPNGAALFGNQSVAFEAPQGSVSLGSSASVQTFGTGTLKLLGGTATGQSVAIAGSQLTGAGGLAITGGDVLLSDGATLAGSSLTLSASGTTRVVQGTAVIDTATPYSNAGLLDIVAGATLATNGGDLVNAAGGTITGSGNLDLAGGTLTNDGIVQPGGATTVGTLNITGNYTQGSGGTLEANLESATSYDVLAVSGTATLGGTLNVSFLNGYAPAAGNAHDVLTYASLTGTFATINAASAMTGTYAPTVFSLTLGQILLNEWISALGGDWASAANWSLGHVPTASEDVQVADLQGTRTISVSSGSQAAKSFTFLGDEVLQLTGGSLTFTADSSLQNLDLAGGMLSGTNLVVTNGITQTSGALSLSGTLTVTQAVGDLTLAGANSLGGFGANAAGNIVLANNGAVLALGPISTPGTLDVTTTGSISGAGLVQASDITLSAVNGIAALTTQTNGLAVTNVDNTVDIRNTGVLSLNSVTNTNGDFLLDNVGDVSVLSPEQVGGVFRIGAHSSIDVQQSITANTTGAVSGTAIALSSDANVTQAAGATLDAGSAALAIDAPGTITFGAVNATAIFINGVCVSGACPAPVVLTPPTLDPLTTVLASTGETSGSGETLGDPGVGFALGLGGEGGSPVQTAALDTSGAGGLGLPPNMADILAELNKLRAQKEKALAKAVEILERDPGIADLKPCAGEVSDECIAPAPEHPGSRGAQAAPKLAYLPAIERKVALLIGEGDYRGAIPKLASPAKDVDDIGRLYGEQFGYEVRTLSNAAKGEIVRELNRLIQETGPGDSVAIFYAGHGQIIDKTGRGYWIPSTASADDPRQWLSNADIARFLQNIPARQLLLVSDSCYSGTLAGEARVEGVAGDPAAVLARRSVTVLSSGGSEPVADSGKDGHSVFAWHFLERLKDVKEWSNGASFYERLAQAVQRDFPQEPQYGAALDSGHQAGGDFLFEVRRY